MPLPAITIAPITPDTSGFTRLLAESTAEGHRMVLRLQNDWRAGTNRFDRPGEAMFGALQHGELIGICGRNIDPYDPLPRAGRVRRLYVGRAGRRQGIGRQLIQAICHGASSHFDHLNAQAPSEAFAFYERLGFISINDDVHVSHRLTLVPPGQS